MSKIENHRVWAQESEHYKRGWRSAERGDQSPTFNCWKEHRNPNANLLEQLRGWDDYHAQEKQP